MMTKKHFESIAKILKPYVESQDAKDNDTIDRIIENIVTDFERYLYRQNPSFDGDKFYQACGYEQGVKPY